MDETLTLWGLFISSFVSSTVFPGGSEAVLGVLALSREHQSVTLLWVASLGNTLGALTTFTLGRLIAAGLMRRPNTGRTHARSLDQVRKFGGPILLLSWLPIVGDPLCLAAGALRLPWLLSTIYIATGKIARYAVILWALA